MLALVRFAWIKGRLGEGPREVVRMAGIEWKKEDRDRVLRWAGPSEEVAFLLSSIVEGTQ